MRKNYLMKAMSILFAILFLGLLPTKAGGKDSSKTSPVQMTVTLRVLGDNKRTPELTRDDIIVRQGNERVKVTSWAPANASDAKLGLFILIDDSSDSSLGSQLDDLRAFINAQGPTTSVGVGYMRNGTVQVTQDFTTDHNLAVKALRLPIGSSGAYGSPYLSAIDIMKRWPADSSRRAIVMVTDGIDRFRGGPRYRR